MSVSEDRVGLTNKRTLRIKQMADEGLSAEAVAEIEGMNRESVLRIFRGFGLNGRGKTPLMAVGIGPDSYTFRVRLGRKLYQLRERSQHPIEVASLTGITPKQQQTAIDIPYSHNWTLSQMSRLAHHLDIDLPTLLSEVLA